MKLEYKCSICDFSSEVYSGLSSHIIQKHKIKIKDYYDTFLKKENEGKCIYCHRPTKFLNIKDGYKKYCSVKCSHQSDEVKNKIINGMKNSEQWQKVLKSNDYKKNLSNGIKNSDYIKNVVQTEKYRNNMSNTIKNSKAFYESHHSKEYSENRSKITTRLIKEGKMKVKYQFDNKFFSSKDEFAYYIWLKDHNVDFVYQADEIEYEFEGKIRHYVPDFKVNNELHEIKGLQFFKNKNPNNRMINPYKRNDLPEKVKFRDDLMEAKHQCMIEHNVKIITDSNEFINYVIEKYGIEFFDKHKMTH